MTGNEIASYPEAKQVMKTFDRARNQSCATAPAQPLSYKKIICGETAIKIVETVELAAVNGSTRALLSSS